MHLLITDIFQCNLHKNIISHILLVYIHRVAQYVTLNQDQYYYLRANLYIYDELINIFLRTHVLFGFVITIDLIFGYACSWI